ncbi:MAG: hypothetical protein ACYDA1_08390 [Vulcanimicrobiaceae bacterium]
MAFLPALLESAAPMIAGSVVGGLFSAAGNGAQLGAMGGLNAQDEAFQTAMYAEQIRHQESMQMQSTVFNEMIDERSEKMREVNTLRDVQMAQTKADNAVTKKFIESISS